VDGAKRCAGVRQLSRNAGVLFTRRVQYFSSNKRGKTMRTKTRIGCALVSIFACYPALHASATDVIATKDAPAAIGPYSQAIRAGNMVFLAGQIAIDPKTGQLNQGSIEDQTRQALDNLKAVLAASNMSMENIVSTTVYVRDLNDFARLNAVYGTYFKDKPPARATVQVQRLPKDAAVEISAIAVR
jgi:2-iminobutanoate/2-iminopropanoate deaminase